MNASTLSMLKSENPKGRRVVPETLTLPHALAPNKGCCLRAHQHSINLAPGSLCMPLERLPRVGIKIPQSQFKSHRLLTASRSGRMHFVTV